MTGASSGNPQDPTAFQREQPVAVSRLWKSLISAFIIAHLVMIALWVNPKSPLRNKFVRYFQPYMYFSGLEQLWSLFAPSIPAFAYYVDSEITYKDGEKTTWAFPLMHKLPFSKKLFKGRNIEWHRRFMSEQKTLPDLARYIARLHKSSPANPPVKVVIMSHWYPLPRISSSTLPMPSSYKHDNIKVLFSYDVKDSDL